MTLNLCRLNSIEFFFELVEKDAASSVHQDAVRRVQSCHRRRWPCWSDPLTARSRRHSCIVSTLVDLFRKLFPFSALSTHYYPSYT